MKKEESYNRKKKGKSTKRKEKKQIIDNIIETCKRKRGKRQMKEVRKKGKREERKCETGKQRKK